MKTFFKRLGVWGVVLTGVFSLGTFRSSADLEVSATVQISSPADFYEPLGTCGTWVEAGGYGHCWHPARIAVGWRPYCDGTWVWTDCGWYWQSSEPWAWACYHYGSWIDDPALGWIWIPDIEWAPAWVVWREGGDHIGWAPCAPHGEAASSSFVFVEEKRFNERHRPSNVIVNDPTIINQTVELKAGGRESRNVGGRQQSVVVNTGPDMGRIQKASGKKIKAVSIQQADHRTVVPATVSHRTKNPVVNEDKKNTPAAPIPPVTPDRESRPAAAPAAVHDFPNKSAPSDQNLPPAKREFVPPEQPAKSEVPSAPQSGPPLKRDETRSQQLPLKQTPPHEIPAIHPPDLSPATDNKNQAPDKNNERDDKP